MLALKMNASSPEISLGKLYSSSLRFHLCTIRITSTDQQRLRQAPVLPARRQPLLLHHLPVLEQQRLHGRLDPLLRLVQGDRLGEPHDLVWVGLGEADVHPVADLVDQIQILVVDLDIKPRLKIMFREEGFSLLGQTQLAVELVARSGRPETCQRSSEPAATLVGSEDAKVLVHERILSCPPRPDLCPGRKYQSCKSTNPRSSREPAGAKKARISLEIK